MLQYLAIVLFLGAGGRLLGPAGREAREVPGDGREQPPADAAAARAARRGLRPRRAVLVENRHSYSISIVREQTKDINRTIAMLGCGARPRRSAVREIVERHRREPTYRPITIVQDATLAQVAAVTARRLDSELPDVVVEQVPTRQYPRDAGRASLRLRRRGERRAGRRRRRLKSGDIVGQSGVEKIYNAMLMGEDGAKRVVVNSTGREVRTLEVEPTEGKRLQLTIDYDVQQAIEDGFERSGSSTARRSVLTE